MSDDRKPDWQSRHFRCTKCDNHWQGWLPMYVPVSVFIASLKAIRCMFCGATGRRVVFDLERERSDGDTL